jgi:hypothetical protein
VSGEENIAGRPKIDAEVIDFARVCKFRFLLRIAIAQAQSAFRRILPKAVWPNINQLPVKSVSRAELLIYRPSEIGPVTSVFCANTGVENTSTSPRASAGRWSSGPIPVGSGPQQRGPPMVGTASFGSYTY